MHYNEVIEDVGKVIDVVGVAVIVIGTVVAAVVSYRLALTRREPAYNDFRQRLGRAILLGLELLVAADIVRTVAATPTLVSIGVLAGIVAIRTFLSFSLEVEITGRWPWQQARHDSDGG